MRNLWHYPLCLPYSHGAEPQKVAASYLHASCASTDSRPTITTEALFELPNQCHDFALDVMILLEMENTDRTTGADIFELPCSTPSGRLFF